jgi:hypothetical protein
MLKKLFSAFGRGSEPPPPSPPKVIGPSPDDATNFIYQLLFCDCPELYQWNQQGSPESPWSILFAAEADHVVLGRLAEDSQMDSRIRMLAYNRIRNSGGAVQPKQLLGTIVEVALPGGVDTLAAFVDGGARYINHTGKMTVIEGPDTLFSTEITRLIEASKPVVGAIGPWDKPRLPAPGKDRLRMTFLVSDGLYFGEGQMEVLERDPMGGPVIAAAVALFQKIVGQTTRSAE